MTNQRLGFARRLKEILPLLGITGGRGQQTALGKKYRHSQQAARQWLEGQTTPDTDLVLRMARDAKVTFEWLWSGRGHKMAELTPKLKDLVRAAEPLGEYQIDQLIKIVPAIAKPEPDGNQTSDAQAPPRVGKR